MTPDPRTQTEVEAFIQAHGPVTTQRVRREDGGRVGDGGALFSETAVQYQDEHGLHELKVYLSSRCDQGHTLGQGTEIAGQCTVCGTWCCSRPGCLVTCGKGHAVCGEHARVREDGTISCSAHERVDWMKVLAFLGRGALLLLTLMGRALLLLLQLLWRALVRPFLSNWLGI